MATGAVQWVLVCRSDATAGNIVNPASQCTTPDGHAGWPVAVQAYMLDPSQQSLIEASVGPFDYAQAGAFWATAFTGVVGLYFVSVSIGSLLGFIRR
jgi:hypothetical protein